MIHTLIVDDEPYAHKVLEGYCNKIDSVSLVGNCFDALSAINFLNQHKVDLILLDIQMPDLTGLELIKSLTQSPKIIFTTAFSEYAVDGYDFEEVVDYLLKPIALPRFIKAISRVERILSLEQKIVDDEKIQNNPISTRTYINLTDNSATYRLALNDIKYIQSWGNYVKVYFVKDDLKIFRSTFKNLISLLPHDHFIQVHKSYIVNLFYVTRVSKAQVILKDDILPIGKSYSMLLRSALKN